MTNHDFDRNRTYREMQSDYGTTSFSPLVIGAAAVIIALVAFLYFADNTGVQQAEFNTNPPVTTTPAPAPERGPSVVPSTPPATPAPAPSAPPAQ